MTSQKKHPVAVGTVQSAKLRIAFMAGLGLRPDVEWVGGGGRGLLGQPPRAPSALAGRGWAPPEAHCRPCPAPKRGIITFSILKKKCI